ncbi:alpha/beta fold hydrolase [endosymbiont of unidentified scaly snail isolate Monju]|uniref:alpha/beta fold hydrolase n=1 Tax=endosymbiont of unidentified scaly snail isolate Monju TaxID=1248727 RepID=UPI0003892C7D|nr:alpha/beta hydrolase [endosymbiont of unidentified scaly snail isolate Monju]BAN68012.1 conserved hypothetical protein [endosymbiont of unidentified scaly snail isolate Monju]
MNGIIHCRPPQEVSGECSGTTFQYIADTQPPLPCLVHRPPGDEAPRGLLLPLFSQRDYSDYQRLGRKGRGPRADLALLKAIEQARAYLALRDERFDLLGYSGGAQFAHRFALLHPQRVRRIGLGAAGWYTWPDPRVPYPRGTGATAAMPGERFDLAGLLRTPILVWVGDRDRERDSALNTSERIDRMQGGHRVARAVNWVRAMRQAGLRLGIRTEIRLQLLPGVTHAFVEADRIGGIGRLVFDDFYDSPTGEDTT